MPEATQARQVHLWGQEGAFYGQDATMPEGAFYGQDAPVDGWMMVGGVH